MDWTKTSQVIEKEMARIMARDAKVCREHVRSIEKRLKRKQPVDRSLNRLLKTIEQSRQEVASRTASIPACRFDEILPITAAVERISAAIKSHQVVVVAGETGSGKTTQLPKICLHSGRGVRGQIACTQPRRIAARAMADRVAEELGEKVGQSVGFQVRFRDNSSKDGYIKFMTDGILLAESMQDSLLSAYDTIIIDEAHERSLNIDFLIGYLKQLLPRRPELKVIITSATIDTERFARHFSDAPVINVSGRSYPVDIVYQALQDDAGESGPSSKDLYQGIADAVRNLNRIDPQGDILVFLSGEREIREAGEFLARQSLGSGARETEVVPLYARLSSAEQRRVFHPGKSRRIVLSTNVAETSLTVPRIRFVIDSGLVRISRYSHRSRVQRLPIEPVSQASANQRAGRCGRLSPGTCVRLYSEDDFNTRPEFTEPEILRTSLASVILRMMSMGLGGIESFPFLDAPAPRMINDAYQLLFELAAIDERRELTALGRRLARWPVDVRLARMVEEGAERQSLEDTLVLAAAISIQDPRERPLDRQSQADEAHERFVDAQSDFNAFLNLWRYLRQKRHELSGNQFRKMCRREFLNWQRVLEWFDLYQQLRDLARENRLKLTGKKTNYEQVHRALLAGHLSHCGLKNPEDPGYTGPRSRQFFIFPGSGLFGKSPKWLMAAEIVETSKTYARTNAVIKPEWIEEQASHLLKRRVFDPHWSRKRGAVMAWEQVGLYGLILVEKRRLHFDRVDPDEARRLFIRHALVRGEIDSRADFLLHNQLMQEQVELREHKRRKRDVMADEDVLYEFFDARIPESVNSALSFSRWYDGLSKQQQENLCVSQQVLLREDAGQAPEELFPDTLENAGHTFRLSYRFEPGHNEDGVSLDVPLPLLNTLDEAQLSWIVPGLLRDRVIAMIRSLPKPIRRSLTPVPSFADAVIEAIGKPTYRLQHPSSKLETVIADELKRMTGIEISWPDDLQQQLPDHLKFLYRIVDEERQLLDAGRDLSVLREHLGDKAQRRFMDQQGSEYHQDGATDWCFGSIPAHVTTDQGIRAWPALLDQEDSVGMRLYDTPEEAALSHAEGVLRLVSIALSDKFSWLRRHHGLSKESQMAWSVLSPVSDLIEDLAWRSLQDSAHNLHQVRDQKAFQKLCQQVRGGIGTIQAEHAKLLNQVLPAHARINRGVDRRLREHFPEVWSDVSTQLADLVYPGFLLDLWPGRLAHYPRYFEAIEWRLEQHNQDPNRDHQRMQQVQPWWKKYLDALEEGVVFDDVMDNYRWLVEEFRVSLFAQKLGTPVKVSEKRLLQAWNRVGA